MSKSTEGQRLQRKEARLKRRHQNRLNRPRQPVLKTRPLRPDEEFGLTWDPMSGMPIIVLPPGTHI